MLPQERLPFGIKLNVGPVVVEEIKLDALGVWTFHKVVVHVPVIRTNQLRIGMPGDIFFTPEGGEAYLKDLTHAEMHRLKSGHFAVEDCLSFIVEKMIAFYERTRTR